MKPMDIRETMHGRPRRRGEAWAGGGAAARGRRWLAALLLGSIAVGAAAGGASGAPLTLLDQWEGGLDYFATGAPLAVDTAADTDTTRVDALSQPASVMVGATDVPSTASLTAAYLYWGGTVPDQGDCASNTFMDDEVVLTLPGATVIQPVTADDCHCVAGAGSYDIQACRAEITALVAVSGMHGTYEVEGFAAQAANGSTDNASFSLVLVYEEADLLPPRRVALYDGLEELYQTTRGMQLSGLDVDTPAQGDLTWYVLDGDVGGAGPEEVTVQGQPGGLTTTVGDMYNPVGNPMNRTINTTVPAQTDVIGVDVDRLDISAGLTPGDTAVDMSYTAGDDKFWVIYNLVGINVFRAVIHPKRVRKEGALVGDADGSGTVTPGDTVRYTIHLENVGTAPGFVTLTDPIPSQFSSWQLVVDGGGTDESTATELRLTGIWIVAGGAVDIVVDAVVGPGTLGEVIVNVAQYDTGDDQGEIVGSAITVREPLPDASVPDGAPSDAAAGADAARLDGSPGDAASGGDGGGTPGSPDPGCACGQAPGWPGPPLWVGLLAAWVLWGGRRRRSALGHGLRR